MIFDTEDGKIPTEVVDELRLKSMNWERMRDRIGLGKLTQKERTSQLEMSLAELSHRIDRMRSSVSRVLAIIAICATVSVVLNIVKLMNN